MRGTAIMVALGLLLMTSGCAKTIKLEEGDLVSMSENSASAEMSCYEWLEAKAIADASAMSSLTKEQQFMYLMQQSTVQLVQAATGHVSNPCGNGTNVYDMMAEIAVAEIQRDSAMFGHTMGAVKMVGSIWAGGWAIGNIVDKATGDAMIIKGENNSMTRSQSTNQQIQTAGQNTGDNNLDESQQAAGVEEEFEGEITEEFCASQGLTLRESTGQCITFEEKSLIEASRIQTEEIEVVE